MSEPGDIDGKPLNESELSFRSAQTFGNFPEVQIESATLQNLFLNFTLSIPNPVKSTRWNREEMFQHTRGTDG